MKIKNKKFFLFSKKKKNSFSFLETIILVVCASLLSLIIGFLAGDNNECIIKRNYVKGIDKISVDDKRLEEFINTYYHVLRNYYEKIDDKKLIDAALNGMFSVLDKHSVYMDSEQVKSFNERLTGDYQGIGAEILKVDDYVIISKSFENSPAIKAGLRYNDAIAKVNGVDVKGKSSSEVSSLIKGKAGTLVKLTIIRNNEYIEIDVLREKIEIPSVTKKIYFESGKKIGYLKIDIFSAITDSQFETKLLELEKEGIDSLIIDVRGNSGGYLDVVSNMSSLFLNKDKVIYQIATQDETKKIYSLNKEKRSYKIVVLTNEYSASASEILAGALKESYGATLVGEKTFGKGTVQETYSLNDGGMIKFTTKKWLTPNGNWVNQTKGIKPDVEVKLSELYLNEPIDKNDNQLKEALKLLK